VPDALPVPSSENTLYALDLFGTVVFWIADLWYLGTISIAALSTFLYTGTGSCTSDALAPAQFSCTTRT